MCKPFWFAVLFILPAVALGHGSNVFDSGHEPAEHVHTDHVHSDHAGGTDAVAFDELHERIDHLEERLVEHHERARMTDIVGGIGYIIGIAGVAYYCLGRAKRISEEHLSRS